MLGAAVWISAAAGFLFAGQEGVVLKDNDRVALVGNTFVERAQRFGHIETAMLLASQAKNLQVRNLGWSGDSVYNDSRSYFGPPKEGRERLAKAVSEWQPTVLFLCYGTGEAMSVGRNWTDEKAVDTRGRDLQACLDAFLSGYRQLIENVRRAAGEPLRELVLATPPPLENLGPPLPNQIQNNQNLAAFSKAIRDLAKEQKCKVLDLFEAIGFSEKIASPALTENGVHYGDAGYQMIARHWVEQLNFPNTGKIGSDAEKTAELRRAVIEKNRLFFHRWRPANETYLFLFRKHEQGNNAKEIPMFDPLIRDQEKKIEQLRSLARQRSKP